MNTSKFANKKIFIGGIQGSGKTWAGRYLVSRTFKHTIGVRITRDFDDLKNITLVEGGNNPQYVLEQLAHQLIILGKMHEKNAKDNPMPYDCLLVEEADLFFQNNFEIGAAMNDLILMHRHYGLAIIFITRRPQDIPARVVESCHYLMVFKIEGQNVMKKFDAVDPKIQMLLTQVDYNRHNFVMKELGKEPLLHKPLPKV
jgi:hypothetical protein